MISRGVLGMLLMLFNGVLNSVMVVSGRFAQELEWPYFRFMAASGVLIFACLSIAALALKTPMPDSRQLKWLILRGIFGALTFVLMIASVRLGASPGDAAAMASINTVVAALLGRLLLGEKLQLVHGVAVLCSMAGSILICRPGFIFGTSNAAVAGYLVAATSGFMQACVFISARKSQGTPLLMLNMSPAAFCVLSFAVLPSTPLLEDYSLETAFDAPMLSLGLIAMNTLVLMSAMCANSAAAMWCPAAVSATMNTGSKMLSGYVAQTLLFDHAPEALTLCGAALMLAAVVIMAAARSSGRESAEDHGASASTGTDSKAVPSEQSKESSSFDENEDAEETESLASFIAAEFVAHEGGMRQRRTTSKSTAGHVPEPEVVGSSAALSAVVFTA
eukprot:CAMPEP_0178415554 /NCGR_PEP_ID=MMETSP0689_2-20121128/23611_1 /TAXON_ID=160604 /ORGANISM="Amphidinium massartii, Strain CS-259" /LENGTH=390 /DNA_ID=CAMNT_0020036877 /DNA_START=104 /DNA_END=1273 /DNA_ORIENTATION=+